MGWDHSLSCKECKEKLIIARNNKLYKEPKNIDVLEQFLVKHANHELIFNDDDNWVRVPDCTFFKTKEEITAQELSEAFASIEKHDLKVNTIICTVCGCLVNFKNKDPVCEHLKKLTEEFYKGEKI